MNPLLIRKTLIASSIAMTLGVTNAQAALVTNVFGPYSWSTDRANFTMLDAGGYIVGGTNDIAMVWDGNAYNASSDYTGPGGASNVTMSSTTQFYAKSWTAHDIQMFLPGTYTFDAAAGGWNDSDQGTLTATVGSGQLGMHLLFDWGQHPNVDMFVVFSTSAAVFGSGIARSSNISGCDSTVLATVQNCLWDGPGYVGGLATNKPAGSTVWMLASTDGNGDGVMGIPMPAAGPFEGFNANFNANVVPTPDPVPVPAAAWLFGSGLLGLFGLARRRKGVEKL